MRRCIISGMVVLALGAAPLTHAQPDPALEARTRAISGNLVKLVVSVMTAEAIVEVCKRTNPRSANEYDTARNVWRSANSLDEFGALMQQFAARYPEFSQLTKAAAPAAAAQAKELLTKLPGMCGQISSILTMPTFAVRGQIVELKEQLRVSPAAAPSAPLEKSDGSKPVLTTPKMVYTLAQISSLTEAAMNRAAPTPIDGKASKEIREKQGNLSLRALGTVAVTGRVVSKDKLRDWRGDQQSTFSLRCYSFVDKTAEQRFAATQGHDITVSGTLGVVYAHMHGGGTVGMYKCQIIGDASRLMRATISEQQGLELRPPESWEANAGPGKGLVAEDITKIVYKAEMNSRLDGLGNMYMDRNERTYLLLKDGTAYHYTWSFPPSDLNVALVKARQPGAWYRWSESGNAIKLTATGGPKAGSVLTLVSYDTLMPLKTGTVFDHSYYFKQVAMGGRRSDRGYTFRRDGTGTFSRSGFVAMSLGYGGPSTQVSGPGFAYSGGGGTSPGFLAAKGASGERNVRYRIDGHTLETTDEDGKTERTFIARFGSDPREPPKSLILAGEVLWSKDDNDK